MPTVKLHEWPDSVYTRTICECTDSKCDLDVSIDVDPQGYVELGFETRMVAQPDANWNDWFWVDWWWRIKTAAKVLFKGHIDMNHYILMNRKGIEEFRETLEQSIIAVETYWAEKDKKKEKA